jgi:hypothetical protein
MGPHSPCPLRPKKVTQRGVFLIEFEVGQDRRGGRSSLDAHRSNKKKIESKGFEINLSN